MVVAPVFGDELLDLPPRPALRLIPAPGRETVRRVEPRGERPALRPVRLGSPEEASEGTGPRTAPSRARRASTRVRRRRLAGAAVVIGALAGLAVPVSALGGRVTAPSPGLLTPGTAYTVEPGDTLWSIATRLDPTGDPRPLVARMVAETGSSTVVPGERIELP